MTVNAFSQEKLFIYFPEKDEIRGNPSILYEKGSLYDCFFTNYKNLDLDFG